MVTITVCVGSSCHLKGARVVIERFNALLAQHALADKVTLKGCFCMERCGEGINWQIDQEYISSATGKEAIETFYKRVLGPLGVQPAGEPGESAQP
jgi:NADH:ubiquinone oxidoreductase subunit E